MRLLSCAPLQETCPSCIPWCVEYLSYRGQAEPVGRLVAEIVADRLARAGCTVADLPTLANEARRLLALVCDAKAGDVAASDALAFGLTRPESSALGGAEPPCFPYSQRTDSSHSCMGS
jgi:hypothetical protein